MADLPPWERVEVVASDLGVAPALEDRSVMLADGRRIIVPADPRCMGDASGTEPASARSRWREMARLLSGGRSARVRIADGRLVAIGESHAFSNPTDIAILSALGLDAEGAMEAFRNGVHWEAPGVRLEHVGGWHPDFHITMPSRFTASFEIDAMTQYEAGALTMSECEIPESAINSLAGRPLGDLVSIPALDGMDLPIVHIEQRPSPFTGKSRVMVELARDDEWVDFLK